MTVSMEETRLKERMQEIINKWKDKPADKDNQTLHAYRTIDRMKFRSLKRQLEKLEKYSGEKTGTASTEEPVDIVAFATELFGT